MGLKGLFGGESRFYSRFIATPAMTAPGSRYRSQTSQPSEQDHTMRQILRSPLVLALLTALGASATNLPPPLDGGAAQRLDALHRAPDSAGTRVYRGLVFAPTPGDAEALYHYERRVLATSDGLTATHITHNTQGAVLIVEAATVSPAYVLRRLDIANRQTGNSGSAVASTDGRHVDFTLLQAGKERTRRETIGDPLVSGPSLHGFVLQHWDVLASGATVPVRMVVLDELRTYGFDIRQVREGDDGRTTFSITPRNWLVRLAVAPLRVTFDKITRHVLRYEGRVPPMIEVNGRLRTLDAHVLYTAHVSRYR